MAEIGNFFVTVGSKFDKAGFDKARAAINGVAKAGLVMGAALAAAAYKAAQAAGIQERAELTLAQAMQQAGTYTKAAFEHNKDYAASLQTMTEYGDEAILGVQKMLTNFGVEGVMLDKLTQSTLDLASAKGMDLRAAADLVSKSVGSTTNALTRYGIAVEGDVGSTERLQMAVDNISKLFGGAAEANAKTFLGAVNQLKNIIGDLWEDVGFKLLPVLKDYVKIIKTDVVPKVKEWIDESGNIEKVIIRVVGVIRIVTVTAYSFGKAVGLMSQLVVVGYNSLNAFYASTGMVAAGLTGNIPLAIKFGKQAKANADKASKGWENLKTSVMDAGMTIDEINALELESFKLKEEGKTAVLVEQSEIQNELAITDAEIALARAEEEATIYDAMKERKKKKNAETEEAIRIEDRRTADAIARGVLMVAELEVLTWRTGAKAFGQAMKDRLKQYIMTKYVELQAAKVVELAKAVFQTATTWGAAAWQIGVIVSQFAVAVGAIRALQNFDKGGIVGGRIGQPQLAIVHGGETVIPNGGGGSGNIYITLPPIPSRRAARDHAKIIGKALYDEVKKSRRI